MIIQYPQFIKHSIFIIGFLFIYLILATNLRAQVILSEIMYDPSGTDTGREWIEIQNLGSDVEVTSLKILENNVNHRITISSSTNSTTLSNGEFAIVADNVEKFLIDFPDFQGKVYDSAFSLNNTGESIAVVDGEGKILNSFSYSSELGANNNDFSLQFNGQIWVSGSPTAGAQNIIDSETPDTENKDSSSSDTNPSKTTESAHSNQTELSDYKPKLKTEIYAGRDRVVPINTPIEFWAEINNKDIRMNYYWAMGDGSSRKGKKIEHTYYHEGEYNMVLNGKTKDEQSVSRTKIKVFEPVVDILLITYGKLVDIRLINKSDYELNLGQYKLTFLKKDFFFPKDTIVGKNQTVIIDHRLTNFSLPEDFGPSATSSSAELIYPNGELLTKSP